MFELRPGCLLSREDLRSALEPMGVDVDHFISRLKPRKVFRCTWLSDDILDALRKAAPLGQEKIPSIAKPANRGRRSRKQTQTEAVIGGVFSLEELGLES